jgi:WXG100 family type VII secretion target
VKFPPEQLRQWSTNLTSGSGQIETICNQLKSQLAQLPAEFEASSSTAFQANWEKWHTSATGLREALTGLSTFLKTTADKAEELDAALRNSLPSA